MFRNIWCLIVHPVPLRQWQSVTHWVGNSTLSLSLSLCCFCSTLIPSLILFFSLFKSILWRLSAQSLSLPNHLILDKAQYNVHDLANVCAPLRCGEISSCSDFRQKKRLTYKNAHSTNDPVTSSMSQHSSCSAGFFQHTRDSLYTSMYCLSIFIFSVRKSSNLISVT